MVLLKLVLPWPHWQVVAVGSGKADDKGNVVKPTVSVGDVVLYQRYAGTEFQVRLQFVHSVS